MGDEALEQYVTVEELKAIGSTDVGKLTLAGIALYLGIRYVSAPGERLPPQMPESDERP